MKHRELVFLSGGITKNPNYERDFKRAERKMRLAGFEVVNPVKVVGCVTLPEHQDYMDLTLMWIEKVDTVFMLCGWTTSEGAIMEYKHAKVKGKNIIFEDGAERGLDNE